MTRDLDFERPILELERQIEELRRLAAAREQLNQVTSQPALPARPDVEPIEPDDDAESQPEPPAGDSQPPRKADGIERQIQRLEIRARRLQEQVFGGLSRWQIVQLSRHPNRPYTLDYVSRAFTDFTELHGDRAFGDDGAIVGGFARLDHRPVMIIGHQKGRSTKENVKRNFGMARPEGYRKAMRLMRLAERFRLPIVTLIDTPGAYPGIDAEARGQATAIAESIETMAALQVPVISVVIGEGGSGGALAIGVANRVLMLEYATYSVISPEGCASIIFKAATQAERAADALKLTAKDLAEHRVIDDVVKEPPGGAHRDWDAAAARLKEAIRRHLSEISGHSVEELLDARHGRFRALGAFEELGDRVRDVGSGGGNG